ncbi:MAG: hypothetical protein LBK73_15875 [Treponema sp.]|nr:hypothetical protein [Treponema sp.]
MCLGLHELIKEMKTPFDRAFARFSEIKSKEIHRIATGGADAKQRLDTAVVYGINTTKR